LRLIAHLWLPGGWIRRRRRRRRGVGQDGGLAAAGRGLRASLKQPQALFELPVTVFQFLVLPGELPQLVFELLNPHLRVDIIGLRQSLRAQDQHRGQHGGMRNFMKSG
jgi:hypothetical protein